MNRMNREKGDFSVHILGYGNRMGLDYIAASETLRKKAREAFGEDAEIREENGYLNVELSRDFREAILAEMREKRIDSTDNCERDRKDFLTLYVRHRLEKFGAEKQTEKITEGLTLEAEKLAGHCVVFYLKYMKNVWKEELMTTDESGAAEKEKLLREFYLFDSKTDENSVPRGLYGAIKIIFD